MVLHSVRQLMEIHVATLFLLSADKRLRYVHDPGYSESELDPAPRFFMGRTKQGNVWRFRYDLPSGLVHDLEQVCLVEPLPEDLAVSPQKADVMRGVLGGPFPITEARGPAYWISENVHTPAEVVLIDETNAHYLEANFPWKITSPSGFKIGPFAAMILGGQAVSICFCARISPWAAEAGVETVEPYRGHGYASGAVAGWASAVRRRGLIPMYSTTWENAASQGIARKLGMVLYGDDWWIK